MSGRSADSITLDIERSIVAGELEEAPRHDAADDAQKRGQRQVVEPGACIGGDLEAVEVAKIGLPDQRGDDGG